MSKLFGTDGIRGVANEYPMTPEVAVQVGRAVTAFFREESLSPKIIIGQDTRLSGDMLAAALAAGICAAGGTAELAGIIPTPAIAYLTVAGKANAGVVISASHNPYYDNGIKVFGPKGFKLDDETERALEGQIIVYCASNALKESRDPGRVQFMPGAVEEYVTFLIQTLPKDFSLKGMKVVIDCAYGATYRVAPLVFDRLGAEVEAMFISPNGKNINEDCGSEHPRKLSERVVESKAGIGLAFDGDGDRLIVVDESGAVLTGDQVLAVCAEYMVQHGILRNNHVVTTVMSNMGFKAAMKRLGVTHSVSAVGDRYVLEKMLAVGASIGGEDSGHLIFLDHHTTGDGLLASLRLLAVLKNSQRPLSDLSRVMTVFPQELMNIEVKAKPEIETTPELCEVIRNAETALADQGRVLVRYSGTQPICRIMVEGPTREITRYYCEEISKVVRVCLG